VLWKLWVIKFYRKKVSLSFYLNCELSALVAHTVIPALRRLSISSCYILYWISQFPWGFSLDILWKQWSWRVLHNHCPGGTETQSETVGNGWRTESEHLDSFKQSVVWIRCWALLCVGLAFSLPCLFELQQNSKWLVVRLGRTPERPFPARREPESMGRINGHLKSR
jgi:hypothetical protein